MNDTHSDGHQQEQGQEFQARIGHPDVTQSFPYRINRMESHS